MSSIQYADKIIVLDNGKIAEMGTHRELFEKSGIYLRNVPTTTFEVKLNLCFALNFIDLIDKS